MEDFSPKVPTAKGRASVLDPYKEIIEGHLDEDEKNRHKQRHTAKRIHDRLAEERGARVGYTTVQLYVKKRRAERKAPRDMFLKLVWASGETQNGLRRGGLLRLWGKAKAPLPHGRFPVFQRRLLTGVPRRELRMRVPRAHQRVPLHRGACPCASCSTTPRGSAGGSARR